MTTPCAARRLAARPQHLRLLALIALFAGAVGISLSPIFVRLADVGPLASAFWRTGLAVPFFLLPLLLPFMLPGHGSHGASSRTERAAARLPRARRDWLLLALAGGFFAADLGVWHVSIGMTSVANATLFPNLAPVIVTLVAWLFFNERIGLHFVAGLVLALTGAVIVIINSAAASAHATVSNNNIGGDLLALLVAFFYAGYLLAISRLRQRLGVLSIMAFSSLFAALLLGAAALLLKGAANMPLLPGTLGGLAALLGLAVVSQVVGQGLIAQALAHLPVSFSSLGLLLQPALAAVFGWLWLHEALQPLQLAGMGIILLGIWLAQRTPQG